MKLIRFELIKEPGVVRSGIAQGGRVYETEDGQGIGVYEAAEVRPLIPVAKSRSVRLFEPDAETHPEEPPFQYANAALLVGPHQVIPPPPAGRTVWLHGYMAAVLLSDAFRVEILDADDLVLGYSLLLRASQRRLGEPVAPYLDLALALGNVLTTPDELDDFLQDEEFGNHFVLTTAARVNSVERALGSTGTLNLTAAQAISAASMIAPVREGDIVAIGPITAPIEAEPGDEVTIAATGLGALSLKIGENHE
jgi:2-keto-4-pentenoate hydratase/2-oxohepta-3-ene-1,7-dioic acid hydratase in catechol pathway